METLQRWTCPGCGKQCERPAARGQRPKWCSDQCRLRTRYKADPQRTTTTGTCARCGRTYTGWGETYCSRECAQPKRPPKPKAEPLDFRSPIRRAYEAQDPTALLAAIREHCTIDNTGCWNWQRKLNGSGYPEVGIDGKYYQVHRLALEAKLGAPLGSQTAHHKCANRTCTNPDHLQPATHRDNIAEMLARNSYLKRIAELENALAVIAPEHELLTHIPVR